MAEDNFIKILLIEDDDIDAKTLKLSLNKSKLNIKITHLNCIEDAEQIDWSKPENNYHCIVLDYNFPTGVSSNFLHIQKNIFVNKNPIILFTGLKSKILQKNIEQYENVYFLNKTEETFEKFPYFLSKVIETQTKAKT